MIVVIPTVIDNNTLNSSTIAEPDTSSGEVEWSSGTYNKGAKVIKSSTHRVYEVVADPSTTDDPEDGILANPKTWIEVGPTNRFAMFDSKANTASTVSSPLTVTIEPGGIFNSVAGFNISADNVNITVNDPIEGEVYNKDLDMNDYSQIDDYYAYFFEPIEKTTEFLQLDLPAYPNATVTVTISGSSNVSAGVIIVGAQKNLGVTEYGTSLELYDSSIKERDEFGNFTIVPRNTAKVVDFKFFTTKSRSGWVLKQVQSITTTPCVWTGTGETGDSTIIFGFYRDLNIGIDTPASSPANLRIEGIV